MQEKSAPAPMAPPNLVTADLSQAVTGQVPIRFDLDARSAFIFRGMAIGDIAVGALSYRTALLART